MALTSSSYQAAMIVEFGKSFHVKLKTTKFFLKDLELVIEHIVDFESLRVNVYQLQHFFKFQGWMEYFDMLNRATFPYLVKDFWVRAEIYDGDVAAIEEIHKVTNNRELKGKSRDEMGLPEFKEVEINYELMGVDVTITLNHISKLLGMEIVGRYALNTKVNNSESSMMKETIFLGRTDFSKVKNLKNEFKEVVQLAHPLRLINYQSNFIGDFAYITKEDGL
ncbi:uncharacterized protein LOC131660967 [Vicia villosa]|uniref:uncharacterized protein LOC131660967 n=1 Tax=Vicia villosa TaxID=3911 RepID=UPI00273B1BA6|nr:uncharacterized protein LOC131660967 [Vicia villosa]